MFPLNLYARVRFLDAILRTRPRVQRAPGLPCALFLEGVWSSKAKLGRIASRERGLMAHALAAVVIRMDWSTWEGVEPAGWLRPTDLRSRLHCWLKF